MRASMKSSTVLLLALLGASLEAVPGRHILFPIADDLGGVEVSGRKKIAPSLPGACLTHKS
jgi:hypothetical protein